MSSLLPAFTVALQVQPSKTNRDEFCLLLWVYYHNYADDRPIGIPIPKVLRSRSTCPEVTAAPRTKAASQRKGDHPFLTATHHCNSKEGDYPPTPCSRVIRCETRPQ